MFGKRCNCSSKPANGAVEGIIDLWPQKNGQNTTAEVLNGIAYNPKTGTIFVTGKTG
jgi:glutamine cyclotransferase